MCLGYLFSRGRNDSHIFPFLAFILWPRIFRKSRTVQPKFATDPIAVFNSPFYLFISHCLGNLVFGKNVVDRTVSSLSKHSFVLLISNIARNVVSDVAHIGYIDFISARGGDGRRRTCDCSPLGTI